MMKKLVTKTFIVGFAFVSLIYLGAFTTADAATGNWTSNYYTDANGVSQVGTTRTSSGAVTTNLKVITGTGATVGSKSVGVTKNQRVEHTCWGQPFLARAGKVTITGSHSPWFNS